MPYFTNLSFTALLIIGSGIGIGYDAYNRRLKFGNQASYNPFVRGIIFKS